MPEAIQSMDFQILDFIQNYLRNAFLDILFPVITYMGEYGFIWIASAVTMLFVKQYRRTGIIVLISLAAAFVAGDIIIKNWVCRMRPFYFREIDLIISRPSGYSFPSGHTITAFAASVSIMYGNKKFGVPAVVLASLTALSRLYLYVHFPSDVVCGAVFGIVIAVLVNWISEKFMPYWQRHD